MSNELLLFLDFDGVLHPDKVIKKDGLPQLTVDGMNFFEWLPLLEPVISNTDIILSTSWVKNLGFENVLSRLPPWLAEKVVDSTWNKEIQASPSSKWWDVMTRFEQIQSYACMKGIDNWIAIDDDDTDWPDVERFRLIKTDPDFGISEDGKMKEVEEKIKIYSRKLFPIKN